MKLAMGESERSLHIEVCTMTLTETIKSVMNPQQVYGLKGDRVTVISTHGHVCLVDLNGFQFPVNKSRLSESPVAKEPVTAAPDPAVPNKSIINRAPGSQLTAAPLNQPSLFNQ